jgi:hypothetical protein
MPSRHFWSGPPIAATLRRLRSKVGNPSMDNDVVAGLRLGYVGQADPPPHPGELDQPHKARGKAARETASQEKDSPKDCSLRRWAPGIPKHRRSLHP